MMTAGSRKLLEIIFDEATKSPRCQADGHAVAARYGEGFHDAFFVLIQAGYIESSGPANTITITSSGEAAAKRQ